MRPLKKTLLFILISFCVHIINFGYVKFEYMKHDSSLKRIMPQNEETAQETISNLNVTGSEETFGYRDMESNASLPLRYDKRFKNPCWYAKYGLHCLPYYFIVGVRKCGTTTLYTYVNQHPESIPLFEKEPQFFSGTVNESDNIYVYARMLSNASKEIEQHSDYNKSTTDVNRYIFGDGSTTYLSMNHDWKDNPGNAGLKEPKYVILDYIHKVLPKAKMIMAVRDPVDRLYSDYFFTFLRDEDVKDKASPQHFHEVVLKTIQEYRQCLSSNLLRFCVYNIKMFNHKEPLFRCGLSLSHGMYHVFMEELLRLFPREQIHLVKSSEIGTRASMERLFEFLEMSRLSDAEMEQMTKKRFLLNKRLSFFESKGPMLKTTQKLLYEFYRPFNEKMAALTGDRDFLFQMADFE